MVTVHEIARNDRLMALTNRVFQSKARNHYRKTWRKFWPVLGALKCWTSDGLTIVRAIAAEEGRHLP